MKNYLLPVLLLTSFYAFETNAENKIPVEHFWCESAMTSGTQKQSRKANSLTTVLEQALQSDDTDQLQWILK